jgi:hypothetical protein
MRNSSVRRRLVLLSLSVLLVGVLGGASVATGSAKKLRAHTTNSNPNTITYAPSAPTFVGPAATGCASGCSLLTGPFTTTSTTSMSMTNAAAALNGAARTGVARALPGPTAAAIAERSHLARSHLRAHQAQTPPTPVIPNVRCAPIGLGCDTISTSAGGAVGVKGLNAVDSASLATNQSALDIEPPDQGLCAGNGDVVETNNIGEILIFDTALNRLSAPIPLDSVMGLTSRAWSSGGDPSCEFDPSNGGHWFFTEIVSASSEANQGAFTGCFAAVSNTCYEGIAVSQGSDPAGPYYVYYLNANYNPGEAGYPNLLNDFAKIGVTRDAFLLFYDEFPLLGNGVGGGIFNGAQEFAFDKTALEKGRSVTVANGAPNPNFNVAIENMGNLPTPDGTCAGGNTAEEVGPGVDCWSAVIPAQPADSGQWDNHYGGSGFMVSALDFESFFGNPSAGDNRVAAWDWTGLSNLNSSGCGSCSGVRFGGQVFTNQEPYYGPENIFGVGNLSTQKAGPIPLGLQCTAAGATSQPCPEGGINPNADNMTQASQAQGQLWAATVTEVNQIFASGKNPGTEIHNGAAYWVIGTDSFDKTGAFSITDQGYVSAAREDMEMPAIAAEGTGGNNKAIMLFTVNGNEGPNGAPNGGYYPSTAYGRLTTASHGLTGSVMNIADAGKSPADGFSEYQPGPDGNPRPRWGDYSWGIYLPGGSDRLYFANEYIQYPNCTGKKFTLTIGTCGGTRDGLANWGTSVNYVVP